MMHKGVGFCGLPIIFLKLQIFVNMIRKVRSKLWFLRKGEKYLPLLRIDQRLPRYPARSYCTD